MATVVTAPQQEDTSICDLPVHLLTHIFSQLLNDPAAMALLGRCACVCTSWREAAYSPLLYVRLTNWAKVDATGEEAPVTLRGLTRLLQRSDGGCFFITLPQKCLNDTRDLSDIVSALAEAEGQLQSFSLDGLAIQADGSSLDAFEHLGRVSRREAVQWTDFLLVGTLVEFRTLIEANPADALDRLHGNLSLFHAIKNSEPEEDIFAIAHRVLVTDPHAGFVSLLAV